MHSDSVTTTRLGAAYAGKHDAPFGGAAWICVPRNVKAIDEIASYDKAGYAVINGRIAAIIFYCPRANIAKPEWGCK